MQIVGFHLDVAPHGLACLCKGQVGQFMGSISLRSADLKVFRTHMECHFASRKRVYALCVLSKRHLTPLIRAV
jgi:hypothetical protein